MVSGEYVKAAEYLKKVLAKARREDIRFDRHYYERSLVRPSQTPKVGEIIQNLLNPARLVAAEEQPGNRWRCYFDYGRMRAHIYVLVLKHNSIKVKTVWILNRDWRQEINARSSKWL
jgi:hypothetical protein